MQPTSTWYDLQNAGRTTRKANDKAGTAYTVAKLSGLCRGATDRRSVCSPSMTNGTSMIAIGGEKGPTPAELAQLIRGLRERHEWSQAALAASAGLSERTIQRVENAEGSNRQTR